MTLIIKNVRATLLSVLDTHQSTTEKDNDQDGSYKLWFHLDKSNKEDMLKLKDIQKYTKEQWKLSFGGKKLSKNNILPFSDSDEWMEETFEKDSDEWEKNKNNLNKWHVKTKRWASMDAQVL